jgi:hypothetical protein
MNELLAPLLMLVSSESVPHQNKTEYVENALIVLIGLFLILYLVFIAL